MENESGNSSGECSLGCASLFVLAGILWPLLHLLGGTNEPEIFFIPLMIGGPSFLVAHILAIIALRSKSDETKRYGKSALKIIWGGIALFFIIGVIAAIAESLRKKF